MASQLAFTIFSLVVILAAWRVVVANNLARAALALVVVLAGLAPIFIMLAAEFVAVVQVLVYVGAVIILFLFGIMLTRSPMGDTDNLNNARRWPAFVIAVALFVAIWSSIRNAFGREKLTDQGIGTTVSVGQVLLRNQVIAFEAISVLLLAALIGAIVIARRD